MAAKAFNWEAIEQEVGETGSKSGNVDKYCNDVRDILSSGKQYTINKLQSMLEAAYNQDTPEGEELVKVNWSTLAYMLRNRSGFREVEHNLFVLDASVVKTPKARGKKLQKK